MNREDQIKLSDEYAELVKQHGELVEKLQLAEDPWAVMKEIQEVHEAMKQVTDKWKGE